CEIAPDDVEAYVLRAYLLRRRLTKSPEADKLREADNVIVELLEKNPKLVPAHVEAAGYYLRFDKKEYAENQVKIALDELGGTEPELFALAAEVAQARAEVAQARAEVAQARKYMELCRQRLESGLKLHPTHFGLNLSMARLLMRDGKPD